MRINVTGNAGTGKSTLARRIAETLDLPLIEMDQIVWEPGWKQVPADRRNEKLIPLLQNDCWVVDGVSRHARRQADIVIFLDFPAMQCAWRCAKRGWKHRFGNRPELPENCPEWRIIPKLAHIIYSFSYLPRTIILEDIRQRKGNDVILTNDAQLNAFEPADLRRFCDPSSREMGLLIRTG